MNKLIALSALLAFAAAPIAQAAPQPVQGQNDQQMLHKKGHNQNNGSHKSQHQSNHNGNHNNNHKNSQGKPGQNGNKNMKPGQKAARIRNQARTVARI
ncbi:hypothetical protein ABC733_23770 [Mangrovibacter sp. SLW1]